MQENIGFPCGSDGKESTCNARDMFDLCVRKIPWRREWLPTPVLVNSVKNVDMS